MEITSTIASLLLLAVSICVVVILYKVERRVKRNRHTMFPYVVLFRRTGDAVPLGTYAVRRHALAAVETVVRRETGLTPATEIPPEVERGFSAERSSWRGTDIFGNKIHVWLAEVNLEGMDGVIVPKKEGA